MGRADEHLVMLNCMAIVAPNGSNSKGKLTRLIAAPAVFSVLLLSGYATAYTASF